LTITSFGARGIFRVTANSSADDAQSLAGSAAAGPSESGGRAEELGRRAKQLGQSTIKNVIGGTLRLCGGMNDKLAIRAKLLEPTCNVSRLVLNDCV
jgi:hypothetical protein